MEKINQQQAVMNDEDHLEFKVGPLRFCAPVLDVVAIISPPKIINVPLSENVVAGCFDYQGKTATVQSMHNKFGLPLSLNENKTHIILANVDDDLKGFWVDQAIDIVPLGTFESYDDFYPSEGKAYSNFLTREDEIILQTSFQRLFECSKSNLNWIADIGKSKAVEVEEAVSTETVGAEATNAANASEANANDKGSMDEIDSAEQQSETIDIATNAMEDGGVANKPDRPDDESTSTPASINSTSTNKTYTGSRNAENTASQAYSALHSRTSNSFSTGINETQNKSAGHASEARLVANEYDDQHQGRTHQATSFENTFANGANTGSRNGENTTSQDYSFSRPEAGHTYDNIDHGESQIENKNSDLYILAAVFLLLLALGSGGIYLVDISSESAKSRSTKAVNYRDSYEARAPKTTAPSIAASTIEAVNNIEPEPVKIAPSENQSLNEVAVEDEAMPEPSANSRVFELHINEKSDSEQYAITSFEPVEHQRETTPDTQQFTHIVVKGDTLWHITRRYLDNPHRYPELAAASHINNPHRIYPGDVIKIIVNRAKNKN